ncbi:hypothetical protein JDV02_000072 [Purpureocillium takamizusanense]|uniref:CCHC-type domain-containing protein n=1 Tax=Purpureocillium takamizusanense TaxID=2060973 RepID=A0A9Q8Q5E0_9HYPO|nr:uncharacterized protein JDV02_000072 [Purpureocillium takamizusanense]UNI13315.1 hypothetical protein JDV02_000072 [Purpureocillium takamizusanense]
MADTFSGYDGRSHEPQCYNCGAVGHWAVACPEPTRATPAGLAAWKNAPAPSQGIPKHHGNSSKRSKGPIITKYAPPPPPQPPSYGPGMGPYQPPPPPPLLPGHHQHPNAIPGPPPAPHYSQYGTPSPSYPPGYTPPPYPYASGQPYHPPSPYGAPLQYTPPGYARPMPGPLPPAPYPGAPVAHDHRPPPSYYGQQAPQPAPAPYAHSSSHHSPRPPPPQPRPAPPAGFAQPPPKLPGTRMSHPLPPKPPPSQDQTKTQRDHRNKRKHDRQDSQDGRHRDHRGGNKHASHGSQYDAHAFPSSAGQRYSSSQGSPPSRPNHNHPKPSSQQFRKGNHSETQIRASTSPAKRSRSERAGGANKDQPEESIQAEPIGDEAGPAHKPPQGKEADRSQGPLVAHMPEVVDQVRLVDELAADDAAPERNTEDEAVETKTVSTDKEEGEIGNDDARTSTSSYEPTMMRQPQRSTSGEPGPHYKRSRSSDVEERQHHKKRRPDSPAPRSDKTSESGTVNGTLWDGLDVPRQADRKRRGSHASQGSKQSSASSKSSDLNSLEAELLGRPVKQKLVADSPPRQRSDRKPVKAKRRPANANSAYSRRW